MVAELIVTAHYAQDADSMFEKASSFADMIEVTQAISTYDGLPALPMVQGRTYTTNVKIFGLIETKDYKIRIDTLCKTLRRMQSSEFSDKVKSWKHTLDVMPIGSGSVWTDHVILDAGLITPVLARYARFMYLHRHKTRGADHVTARLFKTPRMVMPKGAIFQSQD